MENFKKENYKIAILAPTPFYYHVPLYQKLAEAPEIDLTVFYCSDETLRGVEVKKLYRTKGKIVDKEELLKGYNFKFLKNYSPFPSYLHWPFGLINLGIWNVIKKEKYDAIILQSWTNLTWWIAFFACLKFNVPVLFMTDSNVFSEPLRSSWKRRLKKILLGDFLFKKAAGFLTSGTANERFYKTYGVPKEKMVRLPFSWGYEELLFKAEELKSKREDLRKSFGIKKDDFVLLFVGRLSKEKRPLTLLEAYSQISFSNKKLFFVGDGPLRPGLERQIKAQKIKGVYLVGFRPRNIVPNFYIIADALCLPSDDETWGIVVSEAMCFELPIIVSNRVGAAVDLVKEGYNGFLFPAGDSKKLATCIEKLIHLPLKERLLFGKRSKEIITQWTKNFDPVQQMLKMLNLVSKNREKN
jgi:glycosyltransferase involved in cell wall biosynthesis